MDADEREIYQFLKSWGGEFVGATEIARRAGGKKKFHENPDWAKAILMRMQERGVLEHDSGGRYRIKPLPRKSKNDRWVAPEIAKLLQENGVEVENGEAIGSDEYYDQL
jgi:hypothetical protein